MLLGTGCVVLGLVFNVDGDPNYLKKYTLLQELFQVGCIIGMGMAGHAQAKKIRNFFKNLHRLKMVQFAKLTCLNRQIPIF